MEDRVFQGATELTLDEKGRFTVPTRHRELLTFLSNGQITLTKHPSGCLMIVPRPLWNKLLDVLLHLPMREDGWRRMLVGNAANVEIDSAWRISVPAELRKGIGLGTEIRDATLLGVGGRLELWERERLAANENNVVASPMPETVQSFVF